MVAILCQCASNETMAIRGRGTRHHGAAMVMKELLAARQKGKIETVSACIQTRSLFCSGLRCCALLLRAACIQTRSLFCSDLRCCALLLRAAAARYLHSDTVAILLGFALLLRAAAARCLHSDTVAILLGFALHRPRATTHRCSRAPPVQKMAHTPRKRVLQPHRPPHKEFQEEVVIRRRVRTRWRQRAHGGNATIARPTPAHGCTVMVSAVPGSMSSNPAVSRRSRDRSVDLR